jgi:hypothetical protein
VSGGPGNIVAVPWIEVVVQGCTNLQAWIGSWQKWYEVQLEMSQTGLGPEAHIGLDIASVTHLTLRAPLFSPQYTCIARN